MKAGVITTTPEPALPLGQGREVVRAALWLALVAHRKYHIPFGHAFGATMRWINYAQRKADMAWQEQPEWQVRRERRRAAGLCPRCGKVPVPPSAWACDRCKARYRQYWRRRGKAASKEEGVQERCRRKKGEKVRW